MRVLLLIRMSKLVSFPGPGSFSRLMLWRRALGTAILVAMTLVLAPAVVSAQDPARPAQPDAKSRSVVELMNQIETLNADINRLRGQLEVLNNSLENAQKRQRDMYLDLDSRMRRIEQPGSADAAPRPE